MKQVSPKLLRGVRQFYHWCPACRETHPLPDTWTFDGDLTSPSFQPSFKHSGITRLKVDGKWEGEWVRDAEGKAVPFTCHYVLTAGVLNFCADCTHAMAGQAVPLPDLPPALVETPEYRL